MFKFISSLFKKKEKVELEVLDYTSAYSEMPGAPNYINDEHETAMKAPIKKKALDDE